MSALPLSEMEVGGYWTDIGNGQMISAKGEVANRTWDKYIGKSGKIWLHPHDEPENSMVIVQGEPGSRGFGGSEMRFRLTDGTELMLKGPWSSNHDAFFTETGIDRRACYRSWGCVGRHRGFHPNPAGYDSRTVICDLLWFDPEGGAVGTYDRVREKAAQLAFERNEVLFYSVSTYGGGSSGPIFPHECTDLYKQCRADHGMHHHNKWSKQYDIWKAEQVPLWDAYRAEFGDASAMSKLPMEPLDDSEYEPIPQPPKETFGSGDGTDMDVDYSEHDEFEGLY
jgi:hypothetical protein